MTSKIDAICGWAGDPSAAARAARLGAPFVSLDQGFLRPYGVDVWRGPSQSLSIDAVGAHDDAGAPSGLETILAESGWETEALLARAAAGMATLRRERISAFDVPPSGDRPAPADPPARGYALVVAPPLEEAVGAAALREMLAAARDENPGARIVLMSAPGRAEIGLKTALNDAASSGVEIVGAAVSPWGLIDGAERVYVVASLLGFEAAIAGKPVAVFGAPFYAGWGLVDDRASASVFGGRRERRRSLVEVFAAAYLLYPIYYDGFFDRLTDFETTARNLAARREAAAANARRAHCVSLWRWKRRAAFDFLAGAGGAPMFHRSMAEAAPAALASGGRVVGWSAHVTDEAAADARAAGAPLFRMEDGFLRSVGLGQALRTPASLAIDGSGIYYDPRRPSDLERLIAAGASDQDLARARALREKFVSSGVTKYVTAADAPALTRPAGAERVVLVVGQVEDDASIRTGTTDMAGNADLLRRARAARPDAYLVYKPHPDVEAGYRKGAIGEAAALADWVAAETPAPALLKVVDEVWTLTSLLGFEALLHGKPVVCCGWPFYAGWGATTDLGAPPEALDGAAPLRERRRPDASIEAILAAAYLRYPRYVDPVTREPCSAEVVLERLASRDPRIGRHPNLFIRAFAMARTRVYAARRGGL